jgi:atypical dual specificity phosphatase
MSQPDSFTWVDRPLLAAMAQPESREELAWLRRNGVDVLLSLTEDPPRRDWINDTGLLLFHVPMIDMEAPSPAQLERCLSALARAHARNLGVVVHCTAGLGRTGVVLACYFVDKGVTADNAIARVRRLRPGSIETDEQAEAVVQFALGKTKQ